MTINDHLCFTFLFQCSESPALGERFRNGIRNTAEILQISYATKKSLLSHNN